MKGGGAYFYSQYKAFRLNNSIFKQNTAYIGGAISIESLQDNAYFINSSYTSNKAASNGGALYIYTCLGKLTID
jgi:hypothetical protein